MGAVAEADGLGVARSRSYPPRSGLVLCPEWRTHQEAVLKLLKIRFPLGNRLPGRSSGDRPARPERPRSSPSDAPGLVDDGEDALCLGPLRGISVVEDAFDGLRVSS